MSVFKVLFQQETEPVQEVQASLIVVLKTTSFFIWLKLDHILGMYLFSFSNVLQLFCLNVP